MLNQRNQSGVLGLSLILLMLVLIFAIGAVGWKVWYNRSAGANSDAKKYYDCIKAGGQAIGITAVKGGSGGLECILNGQTFKFR